MVANIEKEFRKNREIEARENFRRDLIAKVLELSVGKILENTHGRPILLKDIAEVVRPIIDEYENSDATRMMIGAQSQEDWNLFFDETISALQRKLSQQQLNNQIKQK